MEGEEEDEDVVGEGLDVAVAGVEGVRGEGGGNWGAVSTSEREVRKGDALIHLWCGLCSQR